jgi:hypothetical protein
MKTRGVIYGFFIIFILLLLTSPLLSQPVVLDAKPTVRIDSDASSTTRSVLSNADQDNSRIRIAKQGNRYIWVSRENRELSYQSSGAVHYFIDPRGSGYVKVLDTLNLPKSTHTPGPRYEYMEHLTLLLGSITYWGATDTFDP